MSTIAVEVIAVPVPGMDEKIVEHVIQGRDGYRLEEGLRGQWFLKFSPDIREDSVRKLIHDLIERNVTTELIDNIKAAYPLT